MCTKMNSHLSHNLNMTGLNELYVGLLNQRLVVCIYVQHVMTLRHVM